MLSTILNLWMLVGLLFGAGYVGAWVAEYNAKHKRHEVGNIGFFSGAAGGGLILVFALAGWWSGSLQVRGLFF
jgi:hypothetical protein